MLLRRNAVSVWLLALAGLLAGMLPAAAVPAAAPAAAPVVAAAAPPSGSRQVVTVQAKAGATQGTLVAWQQSAAGTWSRALGPVTVWLGSKGIGQAKEGSPITPAGTFPLTEAFGRLDKPAGTTMPYFKVDAKDWWNGNVSSKAYNTHVRQTASPGGASENLYRAGAVYDLAVVIGYNMNPAVPGAGSAFFLHVSGGEPTAGCVALPRASMTSLMAWLNPALKPSIMITTGTAWTPPASTAATQSSTPLPRTTSFVAAWGSSIDEVFAGDWNGDGKDTLGLRRGSSFSLQSTLSSEDTRPDRSYGRAGEPVLIGDWDGDGKDTFIIRRANEYFLRNATTQGSAEKVFTFGKPGDVILVGDWNGDGKDTFMVRRGSTYDVYNSFTATKPARTFGFGRATDQVLVGDWDGDGKDTLAVRRGSTYLLTNSLTSGADLSWTFGLSSDRVLVGDWNGDGRDSLAVRRGSQYYLAAG